MTLTHHESLSRGADDSTEKLRRLHQELNLLYDCTRPYTEPTRFITDIW